MSKNDNQKPIAYQAGTVSKENLPLPRVLYPGHYGTFFAFQEKKGADMFVCSCAKEAIENFFLLSQDKAHEQVYGDGIPYQFRYFPNHLQEHLMQQSSVDDQLNAFNFRHQICHECNGATPYFRYCHEMYGSAFKQNYGWYINKQSYEWGIDLLSSDFLSDVCPQEIQEFLSSISKDRDEYNSLQLDQYSKRSILEKNLRKQSRKVEKFVENEVRQKFGHKKIGEAWTSETILYYIVRDIFPDKQIVRHYRPDFLEGLELDIFIHDLKVGIEYQGVQHFKAIKHWGGKPALKRLKERDQKKRKICEHEGIVLVHFNYDETLSNEYVIDKLKSHKIDLHSKKSKIPNK